MQRESERASRLCRGVDTTLLVLVRAPVFPSSAVHVRARRFRLDGTYVRPGGGASSHARACVGEPSLVPWIMAWKQGATAGVQLFRAVRDTSVRLWVHTTRRCVHPSWTRSWTAWRVLTPGFHPCVSMRCGVCARPCQRKRARSSPAPLVGLLFLARAAAAPVGAIPRGQARRARARACLAERRGSRGSIGRALDAQAVRTGDGRARRLSWHCGRAGAWVHDVVETGRGTQCARRDRDVLVGTLARDLASELRHSHGAEKLLRHVLIPYVASKTSAENERYDDAQASREADTSRGPELLSRGRGLVSERASVSTSRFLLVSAVATTELVQTVPPVAATPRGIAWQSVVDALPPSIASASTSVDAVLTASRVLLAHPAWETRRQAARALLAMVDASSFHAHVSAALVAQVWTQLLATVPGRAKV
ncbi:hypothetical protein PsorP6_015645 [Peronosclerospora sorghi]|uniref:Uncharacterized protein n=1 Tax=Peronosclerospora sorghi TaxID=230839 RepID=A0ACC0WR72_9STRA|nr:hypothetical protein PsorP6_015645 [Peronosclerospora sorghi]